MDTMGIDLNLLVSLNILIEEANVTRAATRLGVSQPGLSAQLARLREYFDDPLLVPSETGRGMVPTVRALELRQPLYAALKDLESVIQCQSDFDPKTDSRTFAIAASDNATIVLGLAFIERLRSKAGPGIRISFQNIRPDLVEAQLERGDIDILISSEKVVPQTAKARKLIDERFVHVQRKGHPRGTVPLDLEMYCSLEHVLVSTSGGSFYGFIDEQLESLGYITNVILSVHQFILAPMIVERTNFVSTLPERLAKRFSDKLDIFELPFEARGFSLYAAWHQRSQADKAHVWLREELAAVI